MHFTGSIMVGMGQLQFFSNLFFEIMGEGVHIHLTEIFPKLVSSDFLVLANAVFFFQNWGWEKICLNFIEEPYLGNSRGKVAEIFRFLWNHFHLFWGALKIFEEILIKTVKIAASVIIHACFLQRKVWVCIISSSVLDIYYKDVKMSSGA